MKSTCLLVWLFAVHKVGALRTCVDVQETLIACVLSSNLSSLAATGQENVTQLCWESGVMLECAAEAKALCPNLPILASPPFARAIASVETVHERYCQVTALPPESTTSLSLELRSTVISSSQTNQCDPLAEMIRCNDLMVGVAPGDVKAMCAPGEEYLKCMTNVVETCPSYVDLVPFDLPEAINSTRDMLQQECPQVLAEQECAVKVEAAKRDCAVFLSDGNIEYCRSLQTYIDCLQRVLTTCPDRKLRTLLRNQYQHHCERHNKIISTKCPDDVQTALTDCNTLLPGELDTELVTFCRKSTAYFTCVDELAQKCENNTRFQLVPISSIQQLHVQVDSLCASAGRPNTEHAVNNVNASALLRGLRSLGPNT